VAAGVAVAVVEEAEAERSVGEALRLEPVLAVQLSEQARERVAVDRPTDDTGHIYARGDRTGGYQYVLVYRSGTVSLGRRSGTKR